MIFSASGLPLATTPLMPSIVVVEAVGEEVRRAHPVRIGAGRCGGNENNKREYQRQQAFAEGAHDSDVPALQS